LLANGSGALAFPVESAHFCSTRRGIVGVGLDDAQAGTAAAAAQRDGCQREQDAKVENLHVDAAAILPHGSDGSGAAGLDHRKR